MWKEMRKLIFCIILWIQNSLWKKYCRCYFFLILNIWYLLLYLYNLNLELYKNLFNFLTWETMHWKTFPCIIGDEWQWNWISSSVLLSHENVTSYFVHITYINNVIWTLNVFECYLFSNMFVYSNTVWFITRF